MQLEIKDTYLQEYEVCSNIFDSLSSLGWHNSFIKRLTNSIEILLLIKTVINLKKTVKNARKWYNDSISFSMFSALSKRKSNIEKSKIKKIVIMEVEYI